MRDLLSTASAGGDIQGSRPVSSSEWNIAKSNRTCHLCQVRFRPSESYFSLLVPGESTKLQRLDYCPACFETHHPAHAYSFWRTAVPVEGEEAPPKPVLDVESVLDFFRRLAGDTDGQKVAFRYVLALMLTRKRVFKLDGGTRAADGADVLVFAERKGGERHEVRQPDLDEREVAAVSEELGRLLGLNPPKPPAANPEQPAEEDAEVASEVASAPAD